AARSGGRAAPSRTSAARLRPSASQPRRGPGRVEPSRRGGPMLAAGARSPARLRRSLLQPGQRAGEPEKTARGGGAIPAGLGTSARIWRGLQQSRIGAQERSLLLSSSFQRIWQSGKDTLLVTQLSLNQ